MSSLFEQSEDGRLRQFNLSLLITEEFMEAVKNNREGSGFSDNQKEIDEDGLDINDNSIFVWREWPEQKNYITDNEGLVACKYKKMRSKSLGYHHDINL